MPGSLCRFVSFLAVLLLTLNASSQQYEFRNFSSDDGLPQPYVYSLSQDSMGNLWIGTGEGLSKYNGFEFTTYGSQDSMADNFVTCSLADRGRIWFGHMNGTVTVFDGSVFTPIVMEDRSLSRITHFSKNIDGRIWVSTLADGFFRIDPVKNSFDDNIPAGGEMINSFVFLDENELIAATNTGLFKYDPEGKKELINDIPATKISGLIRKADLKTFVIATENNGIFSLSFNGEQPEVSGVAGSEEVAGIQDICEGDFSELWIATFGSGLVKISPDNEGKLIITKLNRQNGYPSDNVKIVWRDREGVIWGGNFGEGLTRIMPKTAFLTDYGSMYGESVYSVAADDEFLWTGTGKGLLKTDRISGMVMQHWGINDKLPSDTLSALLRYGDAIWAGTNRHGIYSISVITGEITNYKLGSESLENSVTSLARTGSTIFAGTRKGLCLIDTGTGVVTRYTISNGLPHNMVNGLWSDREGTLWITTKSNIISYMKEGRIERMPVNLESGMVSAGPVTGDWGSGIWVGTSGQGVLVLGSDSIMNITTRDGLFSDYCYSIYCDGRYIWVGHRGGLSRIDTGDLTIKHVTSFGNHDNLQFNANAATGVPGMIFFGSDKGLTGYSDSEELPGTEPFMPSIVSLRINDDEVDPSQPVSLPAGRYRVRIQFLAISLKLPEHVRYQTLLEGYDNDWSEMTRDNVVVYPGLSEGKYRFLLRSFNSDGVVSREPLTLGIVIKQPLWKRLWFFPVMVLMIGILVIYYVKWKESQHRVEKRILEEKVQERTSEIERQKNELALQRDEIDEKNLNIMSSITYARQIQKAILPPREVLDRAFPENFVLHKPRDIVSGDFYWMAEKNNKVVFSVADCTGHGVPGAFMSLLGITLLNEIVNVNGITRSDIIVSELRRRLVQSLQQNKSGIRTYDGMDISLCVFDPQNRKLQFTGGMNHMVKIREGKLEVIKADYLDVSLSYRDLGDFNLREVDFKKDDMIYLFSDGYQDQFGGEYNKKFLRPHFYTTLVEVHRLPAADQKEVLETKLMNWMKDHPQTDDITIVGIRMF